jgi:hypothetical protein
MADQWNHNPHRVLGFGIKRAEIRAIWPPIYMGFGLISKRIWSWSYFDSSIRLGYTLVGINQKGKHSRRGMSSERTRPGCWPQSATPVWLGHIRLTGGSLGHAWEKHGKARLGRQWSFSPRPFLRVKPFSIFQTIFNLQITLNSTQIWISIDSYSHTRTQEHFIR